jgi:TonB family protein
MKITTVGVMALLLISGRAVAQSTETEISARLMGKPLQLRGFWMDDNLRFDAAGAPVGKATEGSFTESAFDAKKVSLEGDHLRIEGQRVGLEFDRDGAVTRIPIFRKGAFRKSPETIVIEIDGQGNPNFSKELDAIFAGSLAELAPSLRPYWQPFARKHFLNIDPPAEPMVPGVKKIGGTVKPPKVLHSVDPPFSDSAREAKLSGATLINLVVNEQGDPQQIVIARPLGLGLDERAIAAILQYKFAPATRDAVPVKVELTVAVNFQISRYFERPN